MSKAEFVDELARVGLSEQLADFVWDEVMPYYHAPLTPYPGDRVTSGMKIDPDDLSDMVIAFEKKFGRKWCGEWIGSHDPSLTELAFGLLDSTCEA